MNGDPCVVISGIGRRSKNTTTSPTRTHRSPSDGRSRSAPVEIATAPRMEMGTMTNPTYRKCWVVMLATKNTPKAADSGTSEAIRYVARRAPFAALLRERADVPGEDENAGDQTEDGGHEEQFDEQLRDTAAERPQ